MAKRQSRAGGAPKLPPDDAHPRVKAKAYWKRLQELQYLMRSVSLAYHRQGLAGVVVVEGVDAAGKGGAIRRLAGELDPRHYKVWPIGPPSAEESRHHYLWRFWERLPERGLIGIFDRSWYGRVLVERVDNLTPEGRWRAAYDEINAFEAGLAADGARLVKVYLHVSAEEQRRRLAERVRDPYKRWKISADDFRACVAYARYAEAARDVFERTSTDAAPWHVIAANHKRHARLEMLDAVTRRLSEGVDLSPRPLDAETERLAHEVLGRRP